MCRSHQVIIEIVTLITLLLVREADSPKKNEYELVGLARFK